MAEPSRLPETVRRLDTPAARELADLVSIFDELQSVLRCCERLTDEVADPDRASDDLVVEALWTTAVLSYCRCFAAGEGRTSLGEDDVTATSLQGEVLEWHRMLGRLRAHYADPVTNPRERFAVGAALDDGGEPAGIAITSVRQPVVDDATVRQTGALAYELGRLVDQRITARQEGLMTAAAELSPAELDALPVIDVAE